MNRTPTVSDYAELLRALVNKPWALEASILETLIHVAKRGASGSAISRDDLRAAVGLSRSAVDGDRSGAVAVVPIFGVMMQRLDLWSFLFGGTSTEAVGRILRQHATNPTIKSILMVFDSPGGSVHGTSELADVVLQVKKQKRIVAIADSWAASAAYWVASQASEIVVTTGGAVGSVGVIAVHEDISELMRHMGVKPTLVSSAKYKTEGSPFAPLSDEARAEIQRSVDHFDEMFVRAVARGRRESISGVRRDYGQGRMLEAERALRIGMVDRVGTLEETLDRLVKGGPLPMKAEHRSLEWHECRFIETTGEVPPSLRGRLDDEEVRYIKRFHKPPPRLADDAGYETEDQCVDYWEDRLRWMEWQSAR